MIPEVSVTLADATGLVGVVLYMGACAALGAG
jgi:hypothetical protein